MTVELQLADGSPWIAELEGQEESIRLVYNDIANYVMMRGRAATGGFITVTIDPLAKSDKARP